MSILLRDDPGALSKLTSLIAQYRANILHIVHERAAKDNPHWILQSDFGLRDARFRPHREIKKGLKERVTLDRC